MEDLLKAIAEADEEIRAFRNEFPKEKPKTPQRGPGTFGTSKRALFQKKEDQRQTWASGPSQRVKGGVIPKAKPKEFKNPTPALPIEPNWKYTKKTTPGVSIKPDKNKTQIKPTKQVVKTIPKEEFQVPIESVSTSATEFEEFFRAAEEWNQETSSWIETHPEYLEVKFFQQEVSEASTSCEEISGPGPAAYLPNFSSVERLPKNTSFGKSSRYYKPKESPVLPLSPDYNAVKKSTPGFKITSESPKSQKLLDKLENEALLAEKAALLKKLEKLDVTTHIEGGVINPESQLPERPKNTKLGPGRYNISYKAQDPEIKGNVKYQEPQEYLKPYYEKEPPGPGVYETLIEDQVAGGYIPQSTGPKEPPEDRRKALEVKDHLTKKQPPRPFINKPHSKPPLPPDLSKKIGPGQYEPSHNLVEKRNSISVPTFIPQEERSPEKDMKIPLNPDYTLTKPSKPSYKYHEPSEVMPPQVPDKVLNPEKWKFYDYSKDNKFHKVPEFNFSSGLEFYEFQEAEKDKEVMIRINKKIQGVVPNPAVGTYEPQPVAERTPAYDFSKSVSRDPTYNGDFEEEVKEGDVLILNTELKHKVPVLFNMEKQSGRQEYTEDPEYKEEVIIDPKPVKKKTPNLVNMSKATGRLEPIQEEEEVLDLNPNYQLTQRKAKNLVNMEKQQGRPFEEVTQEEYVIVTEDTPGVGAPGAEVYIQPKHSAKKTLVNMEKNTGREETKQEQDMFVIPEYTEPKPKEPKNVPDFSRATGRTTYKEPDLSPQVVTHSEAVPDLEKAWQAVEPHPLAPSFNRYSK